MDNDKYYKSAVEIILSLSNDDESNSTSFDKSIQFIMESPKFKGHIQIERLLEEIEKRKGISFFKAKSHILSLLGDELIGSDSLAIFELVKNAYDADAQNVLIEFIDLNTKGQKIIIEDDGVGMSLKTLENVWLTVGTDFKRGINRKVSDVFERVSFGNKGVGRLAVHKLARVAKIETKHMHEQVPYELLIDWQELIDSEEYVQDIGVKVEQSNEFDKAHGTRITLSNLTCEKWTKKSLRELVSKIENIKNPFADFPDFNVSIKCNDYHQEWIDEVKTSTEVLEDSLYQFNFELKQNESDSKAKFSWKYFFNPPNQCGIQTEAPCRFENSDASYFQISKLLKEEISTDSMFLNNSDLSGIGTIKGKFYVYNLNSNLLSMRFGGQVNAIKNYIKDNCGIKVYRDDIRVYNYGEPYDDWLGLDIEKIQRSGDHFGKKVTIGVVELDLKSSLNGLIEKTNREGFIENDTYRKFQIIIKEIFRFFEREASKDKDSIEEFIESLKPIKKVGFGDTIKDLEEKLKEKNLEAELSPMINRLSKDYDEMRDIMINSGMTGLNLGLAFHEVEREIKFINVDLLQEIIDVDHLRGRVKNLVQILESLSPILRQNRTVKSNAKFIVEKAFGINRNRFSYHNVIFSSPLISEESENFDFYGPSGLLISAISNLIDNAIYWSTANKDLINDPSFKPAIQITADLNTFDGPAIIIVDNGPGFSIEPEYLTQPFKTNKPGGMGLGLYFADLVMNMTGGKLIFPDLLDLDLADAYNGACIALVFSQKK